MSEGRAFALVFVGMFIATLAGYAALDSINANGAAYGLMLVVVGGAAGQVANAIITHYSDERRKR